MVRIVLDLADGIDCESVGNAAVLSWLRACEVYGETETAFARRLGMTYRVLRYWRAKLYPQKATLSAIVDEKEIPATCEFCGATEAIHQHHVVNRYDSPVTVVLCARCHRKFHFLNRLYRDPTGKAPARRKRPKILSSPIEMSSPET